MHKILGNRIATRNAPAWHKLGRVFTGRLSATAAVLTSGLDYQIERRPYYVPTDDPDVFLHDEKLFAIVRGAMAEHHGDAGILGIEDRGEVLLGHCTKEYEVLTNLELAALIDPLTERYPVETIGALGNGEQTFLSLCADEDGDVDGDQIRNYFVVLDSKVPGVKTKVWYSPVRPVCWNTLTISQSEATISFTVRHRGGNRDEIRFYADLVTRMADVQERSLQAFRTMAFTDVRKGTIDDAVASVFPDPAQPSRLARLSLADYKRLIDDGVMGAQQQYDRATKANELWATAKNRQEEYRQTAKVLLERFNDEHPRHAGTVWAFYNACTETSDWREGKGNIGESVLFGARAVEKERAFSASMRLIDMN